MRRAAGHFARQFARHSSQVKLYEFFPQVADSVYVSPSATIVGEVFVQGDSFIGENCVIRGDANAVHIAETVYIGENSSVSALPALYRSGEKAVASLQDGCIVGANCTLLSCQVDSACVIGSNSVVCEGAVLERDVFVGPGSVVPPNRRLPAETVWGGNPVRFVKALTKEDKAAVHALRAAAGRDQQRLREELLDNSAAPLWAAEAASRE